MKINHEETKRTKVFSVFLRVLRFFVVDYLRIKDGRNFETGEEPRALRRRVRDAAGRDLFGEAQAGRSAAGVACGEGAVGEPGDGARRVCEAGALRPGGQG